MRSTVSPNGKATSRNMASTCPTFAADSFLATEDGRASDRRGAGHEVGDDVTFATRPQAEHLIGARYSVVRIVVVVSRADDRVVAFHSNARDQVSLRSRAMNVVH